MPTVNESSKACASMQGLPTFAIGERNRERDRNATATRRRASDLAMNLRSAPFAPFHASFALIVATSVGSFGCQKSTDTAPASSTTSSSAETRASANPGPGALAVPQSGAGSFHSFTAKRLDGKPESLAIYKGKVALVVNTASQCGFTRQYEGLQKLHEELSPKGLVVLGFPSNDFGGQEPGTSQEIATFCTTKFKVSFPMFEKVVTKGSDASPLYSFLAKGFGAPEWNFHKYLVGKDGLVKKAFPSKVTPDSDELRKAIDEALAAAP